MKAHRIIIFYATLVLAPLGGQEIAIHELPDAVRRTLDQASKNDPVKKVTRLMEEGRAVYLAELERDNAFNPVLRIAETGELLPAPALPVLSDGVVPALDPEAIAVFDAKAALEDLPAAVQQTIRNEARGREIADIDRETSEGRTVYEVEFRAEGRNPQLHVAEDGSIVHGEKSRRSLRDFFLGTQLADTPAAVQAAVRREAAGRRINDIDVERRTGRVVYEVEILDPQSGAFQLHLDADGRILKDDRTHAPQAKP